MQVWYVIFVQGEVTWDGDLMCGSPGNVLIGRYDVYGQAQYAAYKAEQELGHQLGPGQCAIVPSDEDACPFDPLPRLSLAARHADPWLEEEIAKRRVRRA